eukprot:1189230-Prorocentrum_minimum.AAC.3
MVVIRGTSGSLQIRLYPRKRTELKSATQREPDSLTLRQVVMGSSKRTGFSHLAAGGDGFVGAEGRVAD